MKPFCAGVSLATALTLAGCSNSAWRKSEVLAVPLQPTLQQEVILARMEQILASRALTDDERAQLLYERGVLYDSLGLRALARNILKALAIRPDMPEVFNYLGIYLTQAGNFDAPMKRLILYLSLIQLTIMRT
jgi:lipoprotein NlpI